MDNYKIKKRVKRNTDQKTGLKDEVLRKRARWIINYIANLNDLSNITMAAELNETVGTVSNYRAMNTSPKTEFIRKFCEKYHLFYEWFISGKGEPFYGAREKFPEICGPKTPDEIQNDQIQERVHAGINEAQDFYSEHKKINIDDAMGKTYKVLTAGTALSVALYMNVQQFAAALETGEELKKCKDEIATLRDHLMKLQRQVDGLTAPSIAGRQDDGSEKEVM